MTPYYAEIAITILTYVILGISLNLILGYAGQVSMAQAVFYGIGAYTAARLTLPVGFEQLVASRGVETGLGWHWTPALIVGAGIAAALALIVALPAAQRVRGEYLILLTLAFQLVVNQLMNSLREVTGGQYGLTPLPPLSFLGRTLNTPQEAAAFIAVVAVLVIAVAWLIAESPFGRVLKGIREHEDAVRSLGKNTSRFKITVFAISAAIAGMAGALTGYYYQFIAPNTYNLDLSIFLIAVVVLGGVGNLTGTVVGATLLGVLDPLLENVVGDEAIPWQAVIYGLALILIVRFRPEGLIPEGQGIRPTARWLGRRLGFAGREPPAGPRPLLSVAEAGTAPGEAGANGQADGRVVVEVQNLSKRFGAIQAVADVDLQLTEKTITALIGPNGAGKTTIFNLVTGAIAPDDGRVVLNGKEMTRMPMHKVARHGMARSFQDVRLFQRLTALENVAIAVPQQPGENLALRAARPLHARRAERLVREKAAGWLEFVGMPGRSGEIVSTMSFGDQKLVAIARVLATESEVLLLDEPLAGVDPHAVDRILDLILRIRDAGKTVCIVEHSVHVMERLADHAYFLDRGRVIEQGSIVHLTQQEQLVEIYFGT